MSNLKHTTGIYSGFTEVRQCITGINMAFHCPNFSNLFAYLEYLYQTKMKDFKISPVYEHGWPKAL